MIAFAAATGLRPSELSALEQGDVNRAAGVLQIRRAYANGRVEQTETRLSRHAVPLQAIALEALDQLHGGKTAGCCSRTHAAATSTSATSTAATGSPSRKRSGSSRCASSTTCATPTPPSRSARASPCSRSHGSWARASPMIDLHYGHRAVDSYQHAVSLLDALALERAVDAGWTPARRPAKPHGDAVSRPHRRRLSAAGGRSVDVRARSRRYQELRKGRPVTNLRGGERLLPRRSYGTPGGWHEASRHGAPRNVRC
jgi:hypothetical protein